MWLKGAVEVKDKDGKRKLVYFCAKHYEEPSEFGINGGRISKLTLKQKGKEIYNYDRGLDIEPQSYEAEKALEVLLKRFN